MSKPSDAPHAFSRLAEELIGDLRGVPTSEPARARRRPTTPLAELIEQLLQKNQIGRSAPEDAIRERWREIVGQAPAAYSHPVRIERGKLLVLTSHAVVRNELFHHRDQIVERIRQLPGCGDIRALNLRAG
jgi:hypothetical protein